MQYVLALDQGTTSSRAIVFDRSGNLIAKAQQEFGQIFPRSGWVEHDAEEIWRSQRSVASQAMASMNLSGNDIAAIGVTNQRETTIVWDRLTGTPICNAIVWQDRRTADLCQALRETGYEELFRTKTGLVLDPYFSGTKVRWILDNVRGARKRAERGMLAFGTVDSWLLYKLTGAHVTDASNASRTLLYNIVDHAWDDELLAVLDIPATMLPEVHPSSAVLGSTSQFGSSIPVAGMAGDQQAALFGQACTRAGMAKNTYGTGCFLLMNTNGYPGLSDQKLLTTIAWGMGNQHSYALEGSVFIGGAVVQWLRDGLRIIESSGQVESLAAGVVDNGGVYFVPAFVGLGAPAWDPYARGTIVGLTRGSTSGHLARAALESIAHQSADVIEAMESDSGAALQELRVDGGAAINDLLMQFQADIVGVPVVRPKVRETTALGAAYLAGLAVNYWESTEEIAMLWQEERTFVPQMSSDETDMHRATWKRALERARAWAQ